MLAFWFDVQRLSNIYIVSHTILVEVLFDDETIRMPYMDVRKHEHKNKQIKAKSIAIGELFKKKKEKQSGYFAVEVLTSKWRLSCLN